MKLTRNRLTGVEFERLISEFKSLARRGYCHSMRQTQRLAALWIAYALGLVPIPRELLRDAARGLRAYDTALFAHYMKNHGREGDDPWFIETDTRDWVLTDEGREAAERYFA